MGQYFSGNGKPTTDQDDDKHVEEPLSEEENELAKYEFPFENLVFEGGGAKGIAYYGVVKELERVGILGKENSKIKRFAGTSAGAITAALLAAGYTSEEVRKVLEQDFSYLLQDGGRLKWIYNLIANYGLNPGQRFYDWFGDLLKDKLNNPDFTFGQLYTEKKKELCLVVTNVNQMREIYCHPKTTPTMPIRQAVRMSMSIPGLFEPAVYSNHGKKDLFVDGGVLCNYPIHCFDGWWLSMEEDHSFLNKLRKVKSIPSLMFKKNRFTQENDKETKSIGFILYADSEQIKRRFAAKENEEPNPKIVKTELYRKKTEEVKKRNEKTTDGEKWTEVADKFIEVLKKFKGEEDNPSISKVEMKTAIEKGNFLEDVGKIFGKHVTADMIIEQLYGRDEVSSRFYRVSEWFRREVPKIYLSDVRRFVQDKRINLDEVYLGFERKDISGIKSFSLTFLDTVITRANRDQIEEDDLERTVGINTGHVDTMDFDLEKEDKDFVIKQGQKATLDFLKSFKKNKDKGKQDKEKKEKDEKEKEENNAKENNLKENDKNGNTETSKFY